MKSIRFISGLFFIFVLLGSLYFIIIDRFIIYEKGVHRSYKQILLENLSGYQGKVIIIGGSDAHHGIDAEKLEELLQRPVINFGGNGDYPYKHYIYNIKKYLKKGDLVIAVIGWPYFFREENLSQVYVDSLTDKQASNQFYYANLPFLEKIRFIFTQLPYQQIMKVVFSRPDDFYKVKHQIDTAESFLNRMKEQKGTVRGGSDREGPEKINSVANRYTCDEYLIGNYAKLPLEKSQPSNEILEAIDMLESLKSDGVQVFFSWGISVDRPGHNKKCYKSKVSRNLNVFASRIREIMNKANIPVLGKYTDYQQPENCFLNTYAHIKKSCATSLTDKMYEYGLNKFTRPAGSINSEDITKNILSSIQVRRDEYRHQYASLFNAYSKKFIGKKLHVNNFDKFIYLEKGWSITEPWGVWSEGGSSIIKMRIKPNVNYGIYFGGIYFNNVEKTEVLINGIYVGKFILTNKIIGIPKSINKDDIITIVLKHHAPTAPASIDKKSTDMRKIKYGLKEIGYIKLN